MRKMFFLLSLAAVMVCSSGCLGPVLYVGDRFVPLKNYKGIQVVDARNSVYKEIHYQGFGFDWDEKDGFIIAPRSNSLNNALWASVLNNEENLYSVLFFVRKERHYREKPDVNLLKTYLEHAYRQMPGSRIKRTAFKAEVCKFKGQDAVSVYMETFERGRNLYLREQSFYFFDPVQPETKLYHVAWSERGKAMDWKKSQAEAQGKRFLECFKLLPAEK